MKLIIDISNNDYEKLKDGHIPFSILDVMQNGTPLPKGHGSLVDVKRVVMALVFHDFLKDNVTCGDVAKILDMATIIEADES